VASKLIEKREELAAKRKALAGIFEEAGADLDMAAVKSLEGDSATKAAEIRRRNDELTGLGKEVDELVELDGIARQTKSAEDAARGARSGLPFADGRETERGEARAKTLGELFIESDAFVKYDRVTHRSPTVEIDLAKTMGDYVADHGVKAAMDLSDQIRLKATLTTTGYPPESVRIPLLVTPGEMAPTVASLMPQGTTSQGSIPYMEETTTTNAAAEVTEGDAKPESTLAFTERTSTVRKIATFLPVTDELFADAPAMRSYVENRLRTFVIQREDGQLLNGDGNAPNLRGILNVVGIQTEAKGANPTPDAIYRAMTKVAVGAFLDASAYVTHHNDWQEVRLLRTVDGIYIWGSPADPGPERIWGLPVVKTTRIAEGTGLVGSFRDAAQIFRRSELAFAVSDSHSDYFQKNLLALRVEERLALVVYRPTGFCTVTGI